jgi:hypothetical protein
VDTTEDVRTPDDNSLGNIYFDLINNPGISTISPIQLCSSPTGSSNNAFSYSYYGNINATDTIQFDVSDNYLPHFTIRVIY